MELASGSYLAEKFQIIDRLSQDEEPPLYLAADRTNQFDLGSLQVLVAIRVFNPKKFDWIHFHDRLKGLRRIKCENVLSFYEVIQEKNKLLVTVERHQGCYLVKEMQRRVFSSYQILQLLYQIATGIEALHTQGITHGAISEWLISINDQAIPKIDPFAKSDTADLDKSVDIKGLGILGLQLIKARHYSPNSFILRFIKRYLTIETYRERGLKTFIEQVLDPQINLKDISYVKNRLSKLILKTSAKESTEEYCVLIQASFIVKIIVVILLGTLGLIAAVLFNLQT